MQESKILERAWIQDRPESMHDGPCAWLANTVEDAPIIYGQSCSPRPLRENTAGGGQQPKDLWLLVTAVLHTIPGLPLKDIELLQNVRKGLPLSVLVMKTAPRALLFLDRRSVGRYWVLVGRGLGLKSRRRADVELMVDIIVGFVVSHKQIFQNLEINLVPTCTLEALDSQDFSR